MLSSCPKAISRSSRAYCKPWQRADAARSRKRLSLIADEKAGRTLHRFGADQVWWVEKGDADTDGRAKADEILNVIDGRRPSAIDHPLRTELFKPQERFRAACGRISRRQSARATIVAS